MGNLCGCGKDEEKIDGVKESTVKRSQYMTQEEYSFLDPQTALISTESPEYKDVCRELRRRGLIYVEPIGRGNYSHVYKAFDKQKNILMAVKVIDLIAASERYRNTHLQRELESISRLRHPNIITMIEVWQINDRIFMKMEFAENGTLADWNRENGAMSERLAKHLFRRIVEGLNFMHMQLIAHRDLKLENILLTKNMQPKLSDFSFAVVWGPNAPLRDFCGTLPYLPPEILKMNKYSPLIADVWSLGVCLYIVLNDTLPFEVENQEYMLQCQLTKRWQFRDEIKRNLSPGAVNVVKRMLEPHVNQRITSIDLLRDSWFKNDNNS